MKRKRIAAIGVLALCCALVLLAGCAGSRTYLLDLSYDGSGTPRLAPADRPLTLAVYQFQDARPDKIYLGRRVYRDGQVDYYKPEDGTVEQVVTRNIMRVMEKAGFKVVSVARPLNVDKEDLQGLLGDVALGGKIETLWVESKSGYTTTDTDARLKLQISWGFKKDQSWMSKMMEGSAQETDRPLFKPKYAEAKINDVFRDALDKMLRDDQTLREKIRGLK
ncbi:MAG TPA: hypothetical protein VLS90_00810 [Thermodesulfobacteriota bacterium]|nr:hypothetical protein [Thermodesulfobacteriota bacterium]